mmetsp:Transcript_33685/g.72675  ORF Transcript_33685/g.72675 Transcript_33685/m.72675 type:complete len:260 (-) Transcript_33685:386-1165(-)
MAVASKEPSCCSLCSPQTRKEVVTGSGTRTSWCSKSRCPHRHRLGLRRGGAKGAHRNSFWETNASRRSEATTCGTIGIHTTHCKPNKGACCHGPHSVLLHRDLDGHEAIEASAHGTGTNHGRHGLALLQCSFPLCFGLSLTHAHAMVGHHCLQVLLPPLVVSGVALMQELRHTPRAILLYESALGGAQQDEIFGIIPAPGLVVVGIRVELLHSFPKQLPFVNRQKNCLKAHAHALVPDRQQRGIGRDGTGIAAMFPEVG